MRVLILMLAVFSLSANAADQTPAQPQPQCYSGDDGKFFNVGEQTKVAGIPVICSASADKKSAQWTPVSHPSK